MARNWFTMCFGTTNHLQRLGIRCIAAVFSLVLSFTIYLNLQKEFPLVSYNTSSLNDSELAVQFVGTSLPSMSASRSPPCPPARRIVFLKTHKTAGTSLSTIIQRYGYTRNLTFAIPKRDTSVFDVNNYFKRTDVLGYQQETRNITFDMLTSHAVYLRPEMDATVPEAFYITSLRDPVEQFESAFVYYDIEKQLHFTKESNPTATFFTNPQYYRNKVVYGQTQIRNGQLYDLGFVMKHVSDPYYVKYKIRQLESEFDFVLIKEYFDESLILIKRLFCWDFDDIVYIPKRTRTKSSYFNNSNILQEQIRKWNHADMLLYGHFNRTLWRKIAEFGDTFWDELDIFRKRVKEVTSECESNVHVIRDNIHHIDVVKLTNGSQLCQDLYRMDGDYTTLIRNRMIAQNIVTITKDDMKNNSTNSGKTPNRKPNGNRPNSNLSKLKPKTNDNNKKTNNNILNRRNPGLAKGTPTKRRIRVRHVKAHRPRTRMETKRN